MTLTDNYKTYVIEEKEDQTMSIEKNNDVQLLSLIHISEPTRREWLSRMPSSA